MNNKSYNLLIWFVMKELLDQQNFWDLYLFNH